GDRRADAAAADHEAPLRLAASEGAADRLREVGVVVGEAGVVRAEVGHVVSRRLQVGDEDLLQGEAGVIGGDRDLHPRHLLFERAFASATMFSTVNPNSLSSSLSGADAPKAARAMTFPSRPA